MVCGLSDTLTSLLLIRRFYVLHSQTHTDASVLQGASWKDHIIRSRDMQHWQESECSPHPPAAVAGQSRGCPWLDYLQPGDTQIANLGLPVQAVKVVHETDNRDNSDVDIVEFNNQTLIMYSWGDQLHMPYNEITVAKYDGSVKDFLEGWFVGMPETPEPSDGIPRKNAGGHGSSFP